MSTLGCTNLKLRVGSLGYNLLSIEINILMCTWFKGEFQGIQDGLLVNGYMYDLWISEHM